MKLLLVGCQRYTRGGRQYQKGMVYTVNDSLGQVLLEAEDDYGRPFFKQKFEEAPTPAKSGKGGKSASSSRSEAQKRRRESGREAKKEADAHKAAEANSNEEKEAQNASGADQVEKDIPDTPVTGPVSEDGVTAEPDPEAEFGDTSGEADDEEGVSI